MFEQVLKQTGGYRRAEIFISVGTPFPSEAPNFLRVLLDVILNAEDRLPPWVQLAIGCHSSGENPLCVSYSLDYVHRFSQL